MPDDPLTLAAQKPGLDQIPMFVDEIQEEHPALLKAARECRLSGRNDVEANLSFVSKHVDDIEDMLSQASVDGVLPPAEYKAAYAQAEKILVDAKAEAVKLLAQHCGCQFAPGLP